MGFRFRKSIKIGNARINLSKSGIGYSVGTKGFRYTKKANGGTRTTASIPGTGISYVTESSNKKKLEGNQQMNNKQGGKYAQSSGNKPRKKRNGVWKWLFILFLAFCIIASFPSFGSVLFLGALILMLPVNAIQSSIGKYIKPTPKAVIITLMTFLAFFFTPEPSVNLSAETTPKFERVALETIASTEAVAAIQETEPPETTATIETTTATETIEETVAETTISVTEADTTEPKPVMRDYVLNTSTKKFHRPSCSSVGDIKPENYSEFHGTYDDVVAKGYEPCKRCHPY